MRVLKFAVVAAVLLVPSVSHSQDSGRDRRAGRPKLGLLRCPQNLRLSRDLISRRQLLLRPRSHLEAILPTRAGRLRSTR